MHEFSTAYNYEYVKCSILEIVELLGLLPVTHAES